MDCITLIYSKDLAVAESPVSLPHKSSRATTVHGNIQSKWEKVNLSQFNIQKLRMLNMSYFENVFMQPTLCTHPKDSRTLKNMFKAELHLKREASLLVASLIG